MTRADSAEVCACLKAIASTVARARSAVVGVLELSELSVLPRAEAELFLGVMRENNPRVTRTAIVFRGDALSEMQIERLVRAAALPGRSVFRDKGPALSWLCEALSATEAARAQAFFDE